MQTPHVSEEPAERVIVVATSLLAVGTLLVIVSS